MCASWCASISSVCETLWGTCVCGFDWWKKNVISIPDRKWLVESYFFLPAAILYSHFFSNIFSLKSMNLIFKLIGIHF